MKQLDVDVLIVGAGPVGLTAAMLLGRMGITAAIVERRPGPQRAPAAHVVNARTLEIFRQAGVDMDAIAAVSKDPADAGRVYWVDRLGGQVLGHLPFERQGAEVLAVTPTPLRNISQHRLEPVLAHSLAAAGLPPPRYAHEWCEAQQSAAEVTSTVKALHSGESYRVRSRYLLACDGAGSRVRKWLGIAMQGPDRIQSFIMIHFRADLRRLVAGCPGVLYWICDPDAGGTLVAHDIDSEWVYMHAWDPDAETLESYDRARCERLVRRALRDGDADISVATISAWTMTAQVADSYRSGRAFLVGDAAHRFPPTGGLGLNTGVQDAHNLMWKIAAVLNGEAAETLLQTYEVERRSVARHNADQSLANAMRLLEVPQALGTLGNPPDAAAAMQRTLADAAGRAAVETAIANQAEHFDMLGLQLGFCYAAGAIAGDAPDADPFATARLGRDGVARGGSIDGDGRASAGRSDGDGAPAIDPVRDFVPSTRPGSRLPHGWVERQGRAISTLDLVALQGMTLIAGPSGSGWIDAARCLDPAIRCLEVGRDFSDAERWWSGTAGMEEDGVLLVRPDQHIAFRCHTGLADPRAAITHAMAAIVGTSPAAEVAAHGGAADDAPCSAA
ncbi:MAG TPA: FAD-dependent monooxygenase [Candidatus Limnocylindrales bacterium]|nr:FAD-dependent monooxygenase [Candidatus Limnocylindrales bacterium]